MKNKLIALIALVAGLAVASGTPEKEEGRKDRGKPGIKQWIEKFDANKDGKLDVEERKLLAAWRKAEIVKKFDKNGDGKLCEKERKAVAEAMKKRRDARPKPDGKGKKKGKGPKAGKKPAKKK
tara:strand:+ start:257 stop:625 length:369 start_codon:yes stop_codon:yes gene_type:complete